MQTTEKTCFKCLIKLPLEAFYKHAQMGDGHLNKCIACTKKDVNAHRQANLEKVRAYDRLRGGVPHRVEARRDYAKTENAKLSHAKSLQKQRILHPQKRIARQALSNAIRDGRVARLPCLICGHETVEGHHPDYDRPLDVVWLCPPHHSATHKMCREIERKAA